MKMSTWATVEGLSPCRSVVSDSSSWSTAEPTAGGDVSSFLSRNGDDSREDGVSFDFHCKFWVRVKYLEENTNEVSLKKMFYPYGADEAFTAIESGEFCGFVGFEVDCMASLASEKMNEFIPCGQSQALQVRVVDLDEVLIARTKSMTHKKKVRSFILEKSPTGAAAELAHQVKSSPIQNLIPLLSSVSVYFSSVDEQTQLVKDELFKLLLVQIVEGTDRGVCANCGTALGYFFSSGILLGDPFQLATNLLQRGAVSVAQADGICTLAVASNATPLPISKASFWALVGHVAVETPDPAVRTALLGHLRHLKQHAVPWPSPFLPSEAPPLSSQQGNPSTQRQQGEARRRTVYVSHLPAHLPQNTLMEFLAQAGVVDKVRVCVSPGYSTMFAFVEMHTVKAAKTAIELNGRHIMGCAVRVQAARNPIQDVMGGDAIYTPTGFLQQHCLFGQSSAPLAACATEPTCVIRHQM